MVTLAQVRAGVGRYLEAEMISKICGWQKWVVGAAASMALDQSAAIFNQLKTNPIVQALGVIDEQDGIDIDRLHAEFAKQAQRGAVTFDVPIIGSLTLNAQDVDKIYQYIIGGN